MVSVAFRILGTQGGVYMFSVGHTCVLTYVDLCADVSLFSVI